MSKAWLEGHHDPYEVAMLVPAGTGRETLRFRLAASRELFFQRSSFPPGGKRVNGF
jgi:hypothetical protein